MKAYGIKGIVLVKDFRSAMATTTTLGTYRINLL